MGGKVSKRGRNFSEKYVMHLKEKVKGLQEKIIEVTYEKENESRIYEREIMVFTIKEADWKKEWKKMKEEVKELRKMVEEKEEKIRGMEEVEKNSDEKEWQMMGTKVLVEKMKEERARRDEAVEKWKQLYLAIKIELDELIHRTIHGDGLYLKTEENDTQMENLKWELQEKEETIKSLKSQLVSVEQEKKKKEREFDLLRQSIRIMNGKKNALQTKEKFLKSKKIRRPVLLEKKKALLLEIDKENYDAMFPFRLSC